MDKAQRDDYFETRDRNDLLSPLPKSALEALEVQIETTKAEIYNVQNLDIPEVDIAAHAAGVFYERTINHYNKVNLYLESVSKIDSGKTLLERIHRKTRPFRHAVKRIWRRSIGVQNV